MARSAKDVEERLFQLALAKQLDSEELHALSDDVGRLFKTGVSPTNTSDSKCDHEDEQHESWRNDNGYHHEDNCSHDDCHDECVSASECHHNDRRCSCHDDCHSSDNCHDDCPSESEVEEKDAEIERLKQELADIRQAEIKRQADAITIVRR